MTTPTPADAVREAVHGLSTLEVSPEEIAADVLRVAADRLLPRPAREDQSPQAVRDRLLVLQFLETANTVAGNPPPAASREESQAAAWQGIEPEQVLPAVEKLAQFVAATESPETPQPWGYAYRYSDGLIRFSNGKDVNGGPPIEAIPIWLGHPPAAAIEPTSPATGEVQELAEWLSLTGENAGQWSEEDADHYDRAATLLRQQEADLATAREALRRLVAWGGFRSPSAGYSADVVLGVADWFTDGMTGPLPPLPPYIASREGLEPTTSAPALPPAIAYGCGDNVVIEATNRELTSWSARDGVHCLNFNGEWEPEPYEYTPSPDHLARTCWPSAEAAWDALLEYRTRGGGSEGPLDPDAMPLG